MKLHSIVLAACLFSPLLWTGCVKKPVLRGPQRPAEQPKDEALQHLEGTWENSAGGQVRRMVLDPNGQLTFQGGMEFFNPGQWEWDRNQQELRLTFPSAPDEKLQIFKLYIGDGVKALDRPRKQVTYHFDADTWTLNIAGWMYSKPHRAAIEAVPEPVLR